MSVIQHGFIQKRIRGLLIHSLEVILDTICDALAIQPFVEEILSPYASLPLPVVAFRRVDDVVLDDLSEFVRYLFHKLIWIVDVIPELLPGRTILEEDEHGHEYRGEVPLLGKFHHGFSPLPLLQQFRRVVLDDVESLLDIPAHLLSVQGFSESEIVSLVLEFFDILDGIQTIVDRFVLLVFHVINSSSGFHTGRPLQLGRHPLPWMLAGSMRSLNVLRSPRLSRHR